MEGIGERRRWMHHVLSGAMPQPRLADTSDSDSCETKFRSGHRP
jgi:hypothetical protein